MRRTILALLLASASLCGLGRPAAAVTVSILPADTSVTVGSTFRLRVVASAFPDLKGFEIIHGFDASRLSLVGVLPGDVLTGTGRAYAAFVVPDVAAPVDSTWLDAAMLDGSTSGPGVLAYLEFRADALGGAAITCLHEDFRDSNNALTTPDCAGAMVHVLGPVPVRRTTFGGLKTIYR